MPEGGKKKGKFQFNFELQDNAKSCLPLLRIMYFGSVGIPTFGCHGFAQLGVQNIW